jgi:hypothetical protein
MSIFKILVIVFVSISATTGNARGCDIVRETTESRLRKAVTQIFPLPPIRNVTKEGPIVMGRSADAPRMNRLHHVKPVDPTR